MQICLENLRVDLKAQTGAVRNREESPVDNGIVRPIRPSHPVEEMWNIGLVILAGQELVAGGGGMRAGK